MSIPVREKLEIIRPTNDISPKAAGAATGGALGLPLAVVVVYLINVIINAFGGTDLPVEVSTAVGSIVTTLSAYIGAYARAETLPAEPLALGADETLPPGQFELNEDEV